MTQASEPSAGNPIVRTVVRDVRLPEAKVTNRVQVREIRIAPSQPAGLHVHNGPVFGSIVTGAVVYQVDGQPASMLRPGDVFYESEGMRIARFDAQEDGVTFLAYFLHGWLPANINAAAAAPARSELEPAHAGPGDEDKGL